MKKLYKYLLNKLPRPLLIRLSYVFKFFAPVLYRGDKVECPVCQRSFSKFLSYGSEVAHRENVLCPYDLTLERHRLMWLYLNRKTNFFTASKLKVLDQKRKGKLEHSQRQLRLVLSTTFQVLTQALALYLLIMIQGTILM